MADIHASLDILVCSNALNALMLRHRGNSKVAAWRKLDADVVATLAARDVPDQHEDPHGFLEEWQFLLALEIAALPLTVKARKAQDEIVALVIRDAAVPVVVSKWSPQRFDEWMKRVTLDVQCTATQRVMLSSRTAHGACDAYWKFVSYSDAAERLTRGLIRSTDMGYPRG